MPNSKSLPNIIIIIKVDRIEIIWGNKSIPTTLVEKLHWLGKMSAEEQDIDRPTFNIDAIAEELDYLPKNLEYVEIRYASINDDIIGYILYNQWMDDKGIPQYFEIGDAYIIPDFRRNGIVSYLINHLCEDYNIPFLDIVYTCPISEKMQKVLAELGQHNPKCLVSIKLEKKIMFKQIYY